MIQGPLKRIAAMEWLLQFVWLVPLGLAVGVYGTLIGAGGGFVLVPLLLLLYPHEEPEVVASISLAVVFCNAASGSWAYARMGRIDYRAVAVFSLATVPGAVAGAITTGFVPRRTFDALLGTLMLALAGYIGLHQHGEDLPAVATSSTPKPGDADNEGLRRRNKQRYTLGALLSAAVGYVSSLLGIGGGVVHVPMLVRVLGYPVHTATATSHLILAVMALAGTVVHVASGSFHHGFRRAMALSAGVVIGAQLGAMLSNRLHGAWILRGLALGLLVLGLRLLRISVSL